MSYIEFDKTELVNIPFSKKKEIVRCSRTGAFASTTLLGLNTRKYHGLFILDVRHSTTIPSESDVAH